MNEATPAPGEFAAWHEARADLFFCLSRAFLPPPSGMTFRDWAGPLAEDLASLGTALGLDTETVLSQLRRENLAMRDAPPEGWLVDYARLFLTPPIKIPLNTGLYLEGSLAGNAAQMMLACYLEAGMAQASGFRDLPDHVSVQVEFLARMHEAAASGDEDAASMAAEFCEGFIKAWVTALERACAAAAETDAAGGVFHGLAVLLRESLMNEVSVTP